MIKVLVIGDAIIDRDYALEKRDNPEGDYPCYIITGDKSSFGGAGFVYQNLKKLNKNKLKVTFLNRGTTSNKLRFYYNNTPVIRLDQEISHKELTPEKEILKELDSNNWDYIIVSDYNKGTITEKIAKKIMSKNSKVLVDCKPNHNNWYRGAYLWKPNKKEFGLSKDVTFENILVTLGEDGALLNNKQIITNRVKAIEVVGAGDVVMATLVYFLATGTDLFAASKLAIKAATISVTKKGKYQPTIKEILGE